MASRPRRSDPGYQAWWREQNPERIAAYRERHAAAKRNKNLVSNYGITDEEYDQLLEGQGGVCAICKRPETKRGPQGGPRRLSVDHDHETRRVRGLLCLSCNTGIANFLESADLLMTAARYVGD